MRRIKRMCKIIVVTAITAMLGFSLAACGDPEDKTNETNLITLSGTIKVPASPAVTILGIQFYTEDWSWTKSIDDLEKTGETTSWSMKIPKFSSSTKLFVNVHGFDSSSYHDGKYISPVYAYTIPDFFITVHNQDKNNIPLNISTVNFIQLNGTLNIKKGAFSPASIKYVVVQAAAIEGERGFGNAVLQNVNTSTATHNFSINVPAQKADTPVKFHIQYFTDVIWEGDNHGIWNIMKDADGEDFLTFKDVSVGGYKVPMDLRDLEEKTFKERISTAKENNSTATISISFPDSDSVCKVDIGGTAMDINIHWKTRIIYQYSGESGKKYKYSFKAWTDSGERTLGFAYHWDNSTQTSLHPDWIEIDNTNSKEYFFDGKVLTTSGVHNFEIYCADQLGTFYISDIVITEITD